MGSHKNPPEGVSGLGMRFRMSAAKASGVSGVLRAESLGFKTFGFRIQGFMGPFMGLRL